MKINIYAIIKPSRDDFDTLIKEFIKILLFRSPPSRE